MSRLGDAIGRQVTGLNLGARSTWLSKLHRDTTVTAAAKAAGIDRRTWQRIESGKSKGSPGTWAKIENALRSRLVREHAPETVNVTFTYDGRQRQLSFAEGAGGSRGLAEGTGQRIAAAISRNDEEGAAKAFVDGVQDGWYHEMFEEAYAGDLRGEEATGEGSDSVGVFA